MITIAYILSIYLAINLTLLAFKPVRQGWREYFSKCGEISNLWDYAFKPELKEGSPWWKWTYMILIYVVVIVFIILLITVLTIIPTPAYRRAIKSIKRSKQQASERIIPSPENWGAPTDQCKIFFDLNLPFEPDIHDVIYVEKDYDPVINDYIKANYDELRKLFLEKSLNLIYLPKICGKEVSNEAIHYMFPQISDDITFVNGNFSFDNLKKHIISGKIVGPALLHRVRMDSDDKYYYFTYRSLVANSSVPLSDQIEWYLQHVTLIYGGGNYLYHLYTPQGDEVADYRFNDNDETDTHTIKTDRDLVEEIRERIKELRKRGVQLYLLRELIEEKPTLSRMVIDKDYRIFLPDYNNVEITMQPLPKAVFFLFLQHPEGIPFKQLDDYFPELLEIYKHVGNREIEENILNSIGDITDPSKNSINEKCSRIREAFLKHFDTTYAQHYYITGKRGEPKKITLPRELVDWQAL